MSRVLVSTDSLVAVLDHLERYGHAADTPCGRAREEFKRALVQDRLPPSLAEMDRAGVPESERPLTMRRWIR